MHGVDGETYERPFLLDLKLRLDKARIEAKTMMHVAEVTQKLDQASRKQSKTKLLLLSFVEVRAPRNLKRNHRVEEFVA